MSLLKNGEIKDILALLFHAFRVVLDSLLYETALFIGGKGLEDQRLSKYPMMFETRYLNCIFEVIMGTLSSLLAQYQFLCLVRIIAITILLPDPQKHFTF